MRKEQWKGVAVYGALLVAGVLAFVYGPTYPPVTMPADSAPAVAEHDCSGRMKEAMRNNPSLAAMRTKLCDDGGEAKVEAMIEDAQRERDRPAF